MLLRFYWRVVEWTGWRLPDVDALTIDQVNEIADHWQEDPPSAACVRGLAGVRPREAEDGIEEEDLVPPRELTEEEWRRKRDGLKAYAAEHGGPRGEVRRG